MFQVSTTSSSVHQSIRPSMECESTIPVCSMRPRIAENTSKALESEPKLDVVRQTCLVIYRSSSFVRFIVRPHTGNDLQAGPRLKGLSQLDTSFFLPFSSSPRRLEAHAPYSHSTVAPSSQSGPLSRATAEQPVFRWPLSEAATARFHFRALQSNLHTSSTSKLVFTSTSRYLFPRESHTV